jgi:hypothetical protein
MKKYIRQKVVVLRSALLGGVEASLNNAADGGWRLQGIVNMVILKGGGMFLGGYGYHFDPNILVMVRTTATCRYRCKILPTTNNAEKDTDAINDEIGRQGKEGFGLLQVRPLSMISADPERQSKGTGAFLLVFESCKNKPTGSQRKRIV